MPNEKTWKYRIWCRDCCGEDFQGCFDGGSELSDDSFLTEAEAKAAGREAVGDCGLWEFDTVNTKEDF